MFVLVRLLHTFYVGKVAQWETTGILTICFKEQRELRSEGGNKKKRLSAVLSDGIEGSIASLEECMIYSVLNFSENTLFAYFVFNSSACDVIIIVI